jgi:hypothetical protein
MQDGEKKRLPIASSFIRFPVKRKNKPRPLKKSDGGFSGEQKNG